MIITCSKCGAEISSKDIASGRAKIESDHYYCPACMEGIQPHQHSPEKERPKRDMTATGSTGISSTGAISTTTGSTTTVSKRVQRYDSSSAARIMGVTKAKTQQPVSHWLTILVILAFIFIGFFVLTARDATISRPNSPPITPKSANLTEIEKRRKEEVESYREEFSKILDYHSEHPEEYSIVIKRLNHLTACKLPSDLRDSVERTLSAIKENREKAAEVTYEEIIQSVKVLIERERLLEACEKLQSFPQQLLATRIGKAVREKIDELTRIIYSQNEWRRREKAVRNLKQSKEFEAALRLVTEFIKDFSGQKPLVSEAEVLKIELEALLAEQKKKTAADDEEKKPPEEKFIYLFDEKSVPDWNKLSEEIQLSVKQGTLTVRNPSNELCDVCFGEAEWRDYLFMFDVMVKEGTFACFVRYDPGKVITEATYIQFQGFGLEKGRWYQARIKCDGSKVIVSDPAGGIREMSLKAKNRNGKLGLSLHPSTEIRLKNVRLKLLESDK